nr:serine/threonine-protein kinase RIO1-like [Ipomoea batatas]
MPGSVIETEHEAINKFEYLEEEVNEEEEESWSSSDEEIGGALDYLDARDGSEGGIGGGGGGGFTLQSSGKVICARTCKMQSLFSLSFFITEWEGRINFGMSNSVTTEIRESVREMAIVSSVFVLLFLTCSAATVLHLKVTIILIVLELLHFVITSAIDPRTRMVLFKMLNRGVFHDINGCISTGKEANVYHASKSDGEELAIKVYKTSVLVFKDRDRYVQGDYRFRYGYCKHNPRKMVKTWAEKEMRNLMREQCNVRPPKGKIEAYRTKKYFSEWDEHQTWPAGITENLPTCHSLGASKFHLDAFVKLLVASYGPYCTFREKVLKAAGIRCPTPLLLRLHVLVMEFIGRGGWAAPRLKDAGLPLDKLREGYVEIIMAMRKLYQKCKLVHGDLSEYNILYLEGHLYIIDVSQAVDLDHPHALDFLREDCVSCDFFRKHGVGVMTIRELFDFIVDPTIDEDSVDTYLEEVQQKILARGEVSAEDEIADSVFIQNEETNNFSSHMKKEETTAYSKSRQLGEDSQNGTQDDVAHPVIVLLFYKMTV